MARLLARSALLTVASALEATCATSLVQLQAVTHQLALVPAPRHVQRGQGQLWMPHLAVQAPESLVPLIEDFMGPCSLAAKPSLVLRLAGEGHQEGYTLNVTDQVLIEAATEHRLFNGLMTLRQLAQPSQGAWVVPRVEILDEPAFPWRGLMLDVSRHFFPAPAVKHLLKTMALFKMNHFHWHLTDDQGWRFPVAKYPKLISLGAHRRATQLGHSTATDGIAYNHSYSEEEISEVLSLAEALHIEVLPEFDLPGHTTAAVASYPELGNGAAPEVATRFGALQTTLAPGERALNFTRDVLSEMAQLFKTTSYIHIGGDEVPTEQWQRSKAAREVAEKAGRDVKQLEGLMLEKAAQHLQGLHKNAVVWDDALGGGGQLPKDTVVMIWRSWEGLAKVGDRAHEQGHSVVLAPQAWTYLDQWQDQSHAKFDAIGGYLPLSKVYQTPTRAGKAEVLGVQGQLWSEYIQGEQNLDYMAWPRGCAIAEVGWSGDFRPGFRNFERRLQQRVGDFQLFHINLGEI